MPEQFKSISDFAEQWGISPRTVRNMCAKGKIPGAEKIGRDWIISANAERPKDGRITSGEINWRNKKEEVTMAKTIKFNLIMDGNPVRNLEGIRENFSIEDILKYFKNGLLARWLEVRSYDKELEKVNSIDVNLNDLELITELIKIFDVETDDKKIVTAVGILNYLNEENDLNKIYSENKFKKNQVIDDYHAGYDSLINHIIENKEDMSKIKADVIELENNYLGLFVLDHYSLFFRLFNAAPKAVFAILTRDKLREYWIGENANKRISSTITSKLLTVSMIKETLGDDLKIVKRNTQAMWDPIEKPEVNLMVLRMESGTFVKNAGEFSEKIDYTEVNEHFM